MNISERGILPACRCHGLLGTVVIDMGEESAAVFVYFDRVQQRGLPQWWLSVYRCYACQRWWLVAQEERQNDVFCLRGLSESEADGIVHNAQWPDDFDKYETLLRLGAMAGKSARFIDPLHSSLVRTLADVAREHPGITIKELCYLLNLAHEQAEEIAQSVMENEEVYIDLGVSPG